MCCLYGTKTKQIKFWFVQLLLLTKENFKIDTYIDTFKIILLQM